MLSVIYAQHAYAQFRHSQHYYAEWRHRECRHAECRGAAIDIFILFFPRRDQQKTTFIKAEPLAQMPFCIIMRDYYNNNLS